MIDTAVIGAGVGGLATATLLARAGLDVTVYEAVESTEPVGADVGVSLHPNGLVVLETLGVLDSLAGAGSQLSRLRLFDENLRIITEMEPPGDRSGHGPMLVVSSHLLHRLLRQKAEQAGVSIQNGWSLTATGSDPLSPQMYFQGDEHEALLVVGADGVESVVRRNVDNSTERHRVRRRRYVRALVDWTLNDNAAGQYWTRRGVTGLLPCGDGKTYWYATVTSQMQDAADQGDLERFRRAAAAAHPPVLQVVRVLESLDDVRFSHVRQVTLDRYYNGSFVLIGDAAHAMDPNLGQGANAALVDAGVLASEIHRRDHLADALAAYDSRRGDAVRRVQSDASQLAKLAHFTYGRRLRNLLIRSAPRRVVDEVKGRTQQVDLVGLRYELADLEG